MKTGISLYPGLSGTAAARETLLEQAASLGICRIFISLHIPECDKTLLRRELRHLLLRARQYGMDVAADISPETAAITGLDITRPQALLEAGMTTIRPDYGFSAGQIALFSRIMNVQLNASAVQPRDIDELRRAGADFSHIDSLHNFYPRPHTGLSETYFNAQTAWLQRTGLSVGAFVPSRLNRRGPLCEGLPTLESHRTMPLDLAARHLSALGVQSIYIGDPFPPEEELHALARVGQEPKNTVVLKARLYDKAPLVYDCLSQPFTARPDQARDLIRTEEGRSRLSGQIVRSAGPCRPLRRGDVTIDNEGFGRYMGDTSLVLADLPAERRTNIAAEILPEEQFLLSYITPGRPFRLEIIR